MSAAPAVSAESSSSGESASATTSATTKPPTKAAIHRNFAAERQDPPEKVKEAFDATAFKDFTAAKDKDFQFWKTQPMAAFADPDPEPRDSGPIEPDKPLAEIRATPYVLSEGFEWCEFDVNDGAQLEEVYQLLTQHYVEDEDNMFRFDYSKAFLNWALKAPGWRRDWHLGVRVSKTKKLVGIITAIPCETRVYDKTFLAVEINFLCVHKKLRKHRLAPVLIREITRRVNVTGRFQATYTAGLMLPKPVSSARYWHRSLNPKKLIECKFSALQPRMTMAMTLKLLRVESETTLPGLRAMEERDVDAVLELLTAYLAKFNLANTWTRDEVAHWLLPRADVVWSYVVEDAAKNTISDFLSFYNLPSTVIGHEKHKQIKAAYTFYTVANKYTIQQLVADALVLAKRNQFDVFNSLDLLEYASVLKDLKFGPGDGHLQYYLYNWRTKPMPANQEALDVRRTYRAIADSTTIRTCVIRCTLLNGVLLMGSVVLFEYVIRPLVAAARLSPDDMAADWRRDALTAVFSLLYYVLWIFPWYVLSYIFNAGWYSKIAKRYFELRQPKRAPPDAMSSSGSAAASASLAQSSGPESAGSAWESVLASLLELQRNAAEAVYTIFLFLGMGIQCSLVGYLPLLGAPLQIAMFAWLSAFYCFDYRWRFGGFNIEQRKQAFASDWAFFLGFGLPITLASHFLPFFISYGIYAVVFPPMIITCIAAQRREPDNGRLGTPPLFVAPSLIAAACVWVLMRGRTVPPGAKTK